jgi:hypothetical protein
MNMKKTVLILTTLLMSILGYSQTFVVDNITYNVTGNTVEITGYNSVGGTDVIIPASVTNNSITYDVTNIGHSAFYNKSLTSVTIGSNVTSISQQAFHANSLTSLVIPNGVTSIAFGAFWSNQLTSLSIPNSITSIGEQAFIYNQLTNVTIPNSVASISDRAFARNQLSSIIIPNSVTSIGVYSFGNNQLTSISIPNSVTSIGAAAFRDNPLDSVTSEGTTPPTIITGGSNDSFSSNRSAIDLIIPNGTMAAYVTDAGAKWTGFNSVTETTTVGVSGFYLNNEITIYPNPVNSQLSIDSEEKIETIVITDIMGKTVETIVTSNNSIDVSHLIKGTYFLKIQTNKGLATKKFIRN